MARTPTMSETDLIAKVQDYITAAGGSITHNALVDALDAENLGGEVLRVIHLGQAGRIPVRVDAGGGQSKPVVVYGAGGA